MNLSTIFAKFFPGSEQAISQSLSVADHATFAAEVNTLNEQLEATTLANATLSADLVTRTSELATATASITTLEAKLATANASLLAVTAERDKYKAHHTKASSTGDQNPDEDANSRQATSMAGYNQNAMDVWKKANRS
ncbi:hypothetical protein [Dyadobacter diqingensis]|uniref:hypothetical protein n=1 Tax=Dyadobacter diqingensis TaxID=2938121 RepID=UPI0020C537F7|nr:hypothetical protein [Dyadobacter diqingensis]